MMKQTNLHHINPGNVSSPLFFLSEHAGADLPPGVISRLGMSHEDWNDHISHDVGTDWLTRQLAAQFSAEAILSRWSRLWVDLNRHAQDPTIIRRIYDKRTVPGNADLNEEKRQDRLKRYFFPFHDYVAQRVQERKKANNPIVFCTIHSFTPKLHSSADSDEVRPWHVGILTTEHDTLARRLKDLLQDMTDWTIGWNEPYSGTASYTCSLMIHGRDIGVPHFCLEIRNDLLQNKDQKEKTRDNLTRVLAALLDQSGIQAASVSR